MIIRWVQSHGTKIGHFGPILHHVNMGVTSGSFWWTLFALNSEKPGFCIHGNSWFHSWLVTALKEQSEIGWQYGIKGFFGKAWTELARSQMFGSGQVIALGHNRLRRIHCLIFSLVNDLLKSRNTSLHGIQDNENRELRTAEQVEIAHYHAHPELLRPGDRHYCERSLQKLLSSTSSVRRRWLKHTKNSRLRQLQDGKRQTTITQFFAPALWAVDKAFSMQYVASSDHGFSELVFRVFLYNTYYMWRNTSSPTWEMVWLGKGTDLNVDQRLGTL